MSSLLDKVDPAVLRDKMRELVAECHAQARKDAAASPEGRLKLKRGRATIPLPGIDVPFHSSVLRDGVPHFRSFLSKRINPEAIDASRLIGKYIPNLIAKPFEPTFEYAQLILDTTASPRMSKVVAHWERDGWGRPENLQKLTTVLVVELLSYQFASPVQWIATQDIIFNAPYDFERFIEFGPSPTLVGMAQRTHKLKYAAKDQARGKRRAMLCHSKDREELYYAFADEEAPVEDEAGPSSQPAQSSAPAPAPVAAAPVAAPSGGGGGGAAAADVPDAPLKATDTVRAILAQKLKKPITEVPLSKSVKDLVGGKSVVQNELIATFQAEFGNLPERAEELPLEELGAALNSGYSGSLGKYTSGLVARMVGGKLPGGFNLSTIKGHLSKAWGLGPGRSDGVLLVALTQEPAKRLGSEGEAKTWLDGSVTAYASLAGISLSQGGGGGGGGGGSAATAISSEELDKLQARHNEHAARHIHLLERFIGIDGRESARLAASTRSELAAAQAQLDAIIREHGDSYVDGINPRFDAAKARHFASYWNWSRQDAMQLFYAIIAGELRSVDRDTTARCITIINRADDTMLELMKATIDAVDPSKGPTYALAKQYAQMLVDNSREALGQPPVYKEVYAPTAPRTTIDARGNIVYAEVKREGVRKLESYVAEMRAGVRVAPQVNIDAAKMQMEKLWTLIRNEPSAAGLAKRPVIKSLFSEITRSLTPRQQRRTTAGRSRRASANVGRPAMPEPTGVLSDDRLPYLQVKRKVAGEWSNSKRLTSLYLEVLESMAREGTTFVNKTALLTGVGRGSIGVEIVKGLLAGGAKVIITTSSYSRSTVEYYQRIYQTVGARGSTLTVVPFNAASHQDVKSLVSYVFDELKWDLDYLVPFAAIPENVER